MSRGLDEPVFTRPTGFQPPRWLPKGERKHIPERNWTWEALLEKSRGREGDAWYHPRLSVEEIERIEMGALQDSLEIKQKPHQRVYLRTMDEIIGASKGKATNLVCVTYNQEGGVHGFPITLDEVKRKTART